MPTQQLQPKNYNEKFRNAMHRAGISYNGQIIADGQIHRFQDSKKKSQNQDGWYVFFGTAGAFGNHKNIHEKWSALNDSSRSFSDEEKNQIQQEINASKKLSDEERLRKQNEIAEEATQIWEKASETGNSEYLRTKQVEAYGIRYGHDKHGNFIAVPLHDTSGKLWSLQKIYASNSNGSNNKWLLTGGRKRGCFHTIGSQLTQLYMNTNVYLCEGYATGASVHLATRSTVIVAFDSGNIDSVMGEITKTYPNLSIVIAADNDCWREDGKNPGLEAANEASKKYGCAVVYPKFKQESHTKKPTDFNDLYVLDGIEEVKKQIEEIGEIQLPGSAKLTKVESPRLLSKPLPKSKGFPIEALGEVLGNTVLEIHDKIQSPIPMCAQSVLSCIALAVQPHINIMLPFGQIRPVVLFFVTIGESGERKDGTDNEASLPIKQYEIGLQAEYDKDFSSWKNEQDAWVSVRNGILKDKSLTKDQKVHKLKELGEAPAPIMLPLLTVPEPTLEGIQKFFAIGRPSLGLFSTEGGQFIGGFGMNNENKIKTSTGLSNLWDGKPITRMRAGDGTLVLHQKKLSIHLMVQPGIHERLLADSELSQQGLLSRILCSFPESAIGTRFTKNTEQKNYAGLKKYSDQLSAVLELDLPFKMDAFGKETNELKPYVLEMTKEAKKSFYQFSDYVEKLMAPGGRFETIRGFANKLGEHASRLAAILAFFENPKIIDVNEHYFDRGKTIALYYAEEALRLFGSSAISNSVSLAAKFLEWLRTSWKDDLISLPDVYQRSLSSIREKQKAKEVLGILQDHGWITKIPGGEVIKGFYREDVWQIRRKYLTPEYMNPCVIDDSNTDISDDEEKPIPLTLAALANFSRPSKKEGENNPITENPTISRVSDSEPLPDIPTLAALATLAGVSIENQKQLDQENFTIFSKKPLGLNILSFEEKEIEFEYGEIE
jgi:putative DNA primase/helicase